MGMRIHSTRIRMPSWARSSRRNLRRGDSGFFRLGLSCRLSLKASSVSQTSPAFEGPTWGPGCAGLILFLSGLRPNIPPVN